MDFWILGPVEVAHAGRDIPIGGSRERAVLARLALAHNRVVSREALLEDLWGPYPPDGASRALLVYLSRLRKAIRDHGDSQPLATRAPGYVLQVEPEAIDAVRFEALVQRAREQMASSDHAAGATLREALALWRGPALAGVGDAPFARAEAARLDEARLTALELRIDADLACGRHAELVGELAGLTRDRPLRERLWAQHMLALYRSGRQADALAAYQDLRLHLGEHLGLEPSGELRQLETAVLRHDRALDWGPAADAAPAAPRSQRAASGGVTVFLFTDVVGSTELRWGLGDAAADELHRAHFRILRHALARHGGQQVKSLGDGLMAVFTSPLVALRCAVGIQEAIAKEADGRHAALEVRVGLHAGEAISDEDDFFGTPVVIAQRLCGRARGRQILASALLQGLVGNRGGFSFSPVGGLSLQGLSAPIAACEVVWDSGPQVATPLPLALEREAGHPLVGRDQELIRLEAAWEAARSGHRRLVLLAGEPGIGKTRLAAEIARVAHVAGAVVLFGRCDEGMGVPYQPVVEALSAYRREARAPVFGRLAAELVRLVPEIAGHDVDAEASISSDPETERYRLFAAVAAWLAAVSAGSPVVLVLDDVHWASRPTLALLNHLARSGEALRLLVVATYRDTAIDVTPELAEALADLVRQPGVQRLRLAGFDDDGVAAYMATQVGHDLDRPTRALARRLRAETGGNLFFVGQVIGHLIETGLIVRRDGRWHTGEIPADVGVPDGVREVITQRLARLPEATRAAMEIAAVLGDQFELDVLVSALGQPEITALQALDPAITAGLVAGAGTNRPGHRFVHALVRATIHDGLTGSQRVELHRRAGEAIAAVHAHKLDDHLPALAQHFARAGAALRSTAADYATRAGDRSAAHLAHEEAAGWYRQALELHEAAGGPDPRRCDLLISLGEAQRRAGDAKSRQTLLDAAGLARSLGDPRRLARAALANQPGVFNFFDETDRERVEVADAALEAVGHADPVLRAQLLATLGAEYLFSNNRECQRLVTEALDLAQTLDDPITLGHIFTIAAVSMRERELGTFREWQRKIASVGGFVDPAHEFWCASAGSCYAMAYGEWAAAEELRSVASRLAEELGEPTIRWAAALHAACRLRLTGRLEDAELASYEAFELGVSAGAAGASRVYRVQLFAIRHDQGRLEEVLERLTRAASRRTVGAAPVLHCVALSETDRADEARAAFDYLATDDFAAVDCPRGQLLAQLVCVCTDLEDAERAAYLYDFLKPYQGGLLSNYASSQDPCDLQLGVLATTLGRYDVAEAHFAESLRVAGKIGAAASEARTRLSWATMLDRSGDPDRLARGTALATDALAAAERFGLARVAERARKLITPQPSAAPPRSGNALRVPRP